MGGVLPFPNNVPGPGGFASKPKPQLKPRPKLKPIPVKPTAGNQLKAITLGGGSGAGNSPLQTIR